MREETGMWRATYTPGTWVVLSGPTSLVIMQPAPASASRIINSIWDAVVASGSIEELARRLAGFGLNQMPSFGALFWHQDQMRSLVRGAIRIINLANGAVIASGEGIQTWTEIGLGDVRQVRVDMERVDQNSVLQLPLVVGAVTASAVVVDATDSVRVRSPQQLSDEPAYASGQGPDTPPPAPVLPGRFTANPIQAGPSQTSAAQTGSVRPEGPNRPSSMNTMAEQARPEPEMPGPEMPEPEMPKPETREPEMHAPGGWSGQFGFPIAPTPPVPPVSAPTSVPAPPVSAPPGATPSALSAPSAASAATPAPAPASFPGSQGSPSPFSRPFGEPAVKSRHMDADALATAPLPPVESDQDPSTVLALECPRQHPNPPDAQRCRQCGTPLSGEPRRIARPVLATLRPSSGHAVDVDRTVLIGRAPTARQVSREDLPKMLTVPSPSHDISRNHVQVVPDGWNLLATDLHSTNGTFLIRPGRREPEPLRPGQPVAVFPGCVLDLGDGATILVDHPG